MKDKLLIALLSVIFLVVCSYLGMDYVKQRNEQEVLTSQTEDVRQTVRRMPQPPQDLDQRFATAQTALTAERSAFPGRTNSTEIINSILELADDCEVRAIPLKTQPWSKKKVGERDYDVFRLNLAVKGSYSQLLTFVSRMENGEFKTLIVESLTVTRDSGQSEERTVLVTASLDLSIYARSLASD